jgi:hypothetical protein
MWNELCDDAHDAQTMKVINRAVVVIALSFITFGGYAISTRLGADAPPSSVTYGSEAPHASAAVLGD